VLKTNAFLAYTHSTYPSNTGNRISLISKKNIRYEGILYSINEQSATVALKNVKSFGTEGKYDLFRLRAQTNGSFHPLP